MGGKKDKRKREKKEKKKAKKQRLEELALAESTPSEPIVSPPPQPVVRGTEGVPLGPAFRARAEGRPFNVKLMPSAYVPKVGPDGKPLSKIAPYLPVLGACQLCPSRCCRLNVKVSLPDAVHYCKTIGVPFFAGLTFVPSDHRTHSFQIERDPRIVPAENGWAGRAEIQLKRQEDGACHALLRLGGYERCGVYEARPSLCRLYPMTWTSEVAQGGPEAVLCPIPYGFTEEEEAKFIREAESSIERWEIHDDVVLAWHQHTPANGRTIRTFLEFAIPLAAERMGIDPSGILAEGWPEQRLYDQMVASKVIRQQTPLLPQPSTRPWAGLIPRAPRPNADE